jgi:16S rRNA pseudouridine516 synthase
VQLDRFLKHHTPHSQKQIRQFIIDGCVRVDGIISKNVQYPVTHFTHVQFNQTVLQAKTPYYLMLNKPAGIVSATAHPHHRTVIDCIAEPFADQLHLAGRLDFNSTGLMLLTNDGVWSRKITQPEEKFAKTYVVTTEDEITPEYVTRFASGMYFAYEDMHLQPAELDILSSHSARIRIYEGRYHQIKRMFGSFNNKVLTLHREAIGSIKLDPDLLSGQYRPLRDDEILL